MATQPATDSAIPASSNPAMERRGGLVNRVRRSRMAFTRQNGWPRWKVQFTSEIFCATEPFGPSGSLSFTLMIRVRSTLTDEQASRRFYADVWPHAAAVLRSARMLTHAAAEADDLTQDTMLKAYESIERLQPGTNALGWLLTILRNSWIDRHRSKQSRPTVPLIDSDVPLREAAEGDDVWSEPDDILFRFGDADIIAALHGLPDDIRWTLLLVDVQGLPHPEAAEVLGVPVGTIKSRAHRGRAMLRDALAPRARELGFVPRDPCAAEPRREATP